MPTTRHIEKHFTAAEKVRDVVIGMSDGLTVPFALAAGLSGAVMSTGIVVTAGMAEIVAGAIAMGLGGYLAAKTDLEHYNAEQVRERAEIEKMPEEEANEVAEVFRNYGLEDEQITSIVSAISASPDRWVDFMMRFELGLETPNRARAWQSALTIGGSYVVGGLIPLAPYMLMGSILSALWVSIGVTLIALLVFGYIKGHFTGISPLRGGFQTVFTGGLAAAAAFAIARMIRT